MTAHAQLSFEKLLALASGVSFNVLYLIFECVPPPPLPNVPFCQQTFLAHSHNISKWRPGSGGGGETGSTKQKKKKKQKR